MCIRDRLKAEQAFKQSHQKWLDAQAATREVRAQATQPAAKLGELEQRLFSDEIFDNHPVVSKVTALENMLVQEDEKTAEELKSDLRTLETNASATSERNNARTQRALVENTVLRREILAHISAGVRRTAAVDDATLAALPPALSLAAAPLALSAAPVAVEAPAESVGASWLRPGGAAGGAARDGGEEPRARRDAHPAS